MLIYPFRGIFTQTIHIIVPVKGKGLESNAGDRLMDRISPRFFNPSHTTIVRVPLFEIDLGKAMYHGAYFHLFEIARDDFFRSIGFPYSQLMNLGHHLTIAQLTCRYFAGLHYDEIVHIHTGLLELRSRSLSIIQRIDREGKVCTQAEFAMVCVDHMGRPARIPEKLRTILSVWTIKEETTFEA